MIGRFDQRHHLDRGETRLTATLVIERGDAHQAMRAALDGQTAIRIRRIHLERGGLDAGLLGIRRIHHLGLETIAFAIPQIHAQQHLGEIGGIHATGAGTNGDDRGTLVILAVQQSLDLHIVQIALDLLHFLLRLGKSVGVLFLLAELDQGLHIIDALRRGVETLQLRLRSGQATGHLLRILGIIPQTRLRRLLLQLGDLRLQTIHIQRLGDRPVLRTSLGNRLGKIKFCHYDSPYVCSVEIVCEHAWGLHPTQRVYTHSLRARRCLPFPCGREPAVRRRKTPPQQYAKGRQRPA